MRLMLDTNVFNKLLDGTLDKSILSGNTLVTTHIQRDELENTRNDNRRRSLIAEYEAITMISTPTESFVLNVSRLNNAKLSSADSKFKLMAERLRVLDTKAKKSSSDLNQARDILILETAIANNCTLVTGDKNLAAVCNEYGGSVSIIAN